MRIETEIGRYLELEADDLSDFAATYLTPERRVVLHVVRSPVT